MVDLGAPVLQLASARGSPGIRAPFTELRVTQTGSHRSGGHTVWSAPRTKQTRRKKSSTDVIFGAASRLPVEAARSASRTFEARRHDSRGSKGPEVRASCPAAVWGAVVTRCRRRPPGLLGCRGDGSQRGVSFQVRSLSRVGCVWLPRTSAASGANG